MNHIGEVINRYRCQIGMNRKELSDDICTEKYVYLIERGERTPSSDILKLFSDRLGVDLFDYYEYLDCIDPLSVKKYIAEFKMYRAKHEPELLQESTEKARELPDFNNVPWSYEIKINEFFHAIYFMKEYEKTIADINDFLKKIEAKYSHSEYVVNTLVALSACYVFIGDLQNSRQASTNARNILSSKYKTRSHEHTLMNIKLNIMTVSYLLEEYDNVIQEGNGIIQYQSAKSSYDRVFYAFFYTAFAYYKMGMNDKALANFRKGLYISLTEDLTNDIKYIVMQDVFPELINDETINKELVKEFYGKYQLAVG